MKIKEIQVNKTLDGYPLLNITLERVPNSSIEEILSLVGTDLSKYDLSIVKSKNKRSLDANSYAWVLMGKLARKLNTTAEEVYRDYISSTSAFKIVPMLPEAIEQWEKIWSSKGTGWLIKDLGDCKTLKGYRNIVCFYGSSTYTQDEMSHLIELIVADCKEQGIETMTPDEIERLKATWR